MTAAVIGGLFYMTKSDVRQGLLCFREREDDTVVDRARGTEVSTRVDETSAVPPRPARPTPTPPHPTRSTGEPGLTDPSNPLPPPALLRASRLSVKPTKPKEIPRDGAPGSPQGQEGRLRAPTLVCILTTAVIPCPPSSPTHPRVGGRPGADTLSSSASDPRGRRPGHSGIGIVHLYSPRPARRRTAVAPAAAVKPGGRARREPRSGAQPTLTLPWARRVAHAVRASLFWPLRSAPGSAQTSARVVWAGKGRLHAQQQQQKGRNGRRRPPSCLYPGG